jgi:hypothetical protein
VLASFSFRLDDTTLTSAEDIERHLNHRACLDR